MSIKRHLILSSSPLLKRLSSALLTVCCLTSLVIAPSCADQVDLIDEESQRFLEGDDYAPTPLEGDRLLLEKADVIVLPTISISVYVIGAIAAYVSGILIYESLPDEGMDLWDSAWSGSHMSDYHYLTEDAIDLESEVTAQAEQLNRALSEFAYRTTDTPLPGITGEMYITFLNAYASANASSHGISLEEMRENLEGRLKPLAEAPRDFLNSLRIASSRSRTLNSSAGLCVKARVDDKEGAPFIGRAKAKGPEDVIRATILASLKATARCGVYHEEVMSQVRKYAEVQGEFRIVDQLFYHLFVTGQVIYSYAGQCQLPPQVEVLEGQESCADSGWL